MQTKNPLRFRNSTGNLIVSALFMETGTAPDYAYYTVEREDHPSGFVSLYKRYMDIADPTEYKFAIECFESPQHWDRVQQLSWFKPFIAQWREELQLKLRSEALARLIAEGKAGGRSAASINRFLVEKGWVEKSEKGRPKKEDIVRAAHDIALEREATAEDASRILKLVQGTA